MYTIRKLFDNRHIPTLKVFVSYSRIFCVGSCIAIFSLMACIKRDCVRYDKGLRAIVILDKNEIRKEKIRSE